MLAALDLTADTMQLLHRLLTGKCNATNIAMMLWYVFFYSFTTDHQVCNSAADCGATIPRTRLSAVLMRCILDSIQISVYSIAAGDSTGGHVSFTFHHKHKNVSVMAMLCYIMMSMVASQNALCAGSFAL